MRQTFQKPFWKDPLKLAIWLYLVLLITEGALRKWILPGLSQPLLIARDPVVLVIYLMAMGRYQKAFTNPWCLGFLVISGAGFATAMTVGHGNLMVALFGFRTFYFHVPLILVMGYALNKHDVVQMGKFILLVTIPMTFLMVAQFSLPQSHLVNRLPGGEVGYGLTGALGRFRPPGTFSFITGVVQFYTLAAAFLLGAFLEKSYLPKWILLGVAMACIAAIPISISRSLFLGVIIVAAFAAYGLMRSGIKMSGVFQILLVGGLGFYLVSGTTAFEEGMAAFSTRWEISTGDSQGGVERAIFGRLYLDHIQPFFYLGFFDLFGQGIGIGTQVAAGLTMGKRGFLAGEGEWFRMLSELGFILGPALIFLRLAFASWMGLLCHKVLARKNLLPWLLFSSSSLLLINGQWGQPTTLGFSVFGAGLCLASLKVPTKKRQPTATPPAPERSRVVPVPSGLSSVSVTEPLETIAPPDLSTSLPLMVRDMVPKPEQPLQPTPPCKVVRRFSPPDA